MKNVFPTHRVVAATAMAFLVAASFSVHAATINWTNAASGGWNTAANWKPNSVPSTNDTAIITNAGVTVSLNGATTIGAIILGTNGAGTVTLSLAGWTLALDGPLTVNPNGSFTVDGGALIGNTNAVLHGTIGWSAASLGGILTLASGGTLNINAIGNGQISGCILTNLGTVNWSAGALLAGGGTAFYNYGLWNAQGENYISNDAGGAGTVFNNFGTFRKSAGISASQTLIATPVTFNNAGIVAAQQGNLLLQGGGSFTGGYITTNVNGLTVLSGGSFNLNGTVTGTNVSEDGGNLVGTNVINGALTWHDGYWNNTVVTVGSNSVLNISTAGYNHAMNGCILTNFGTVNWSASALLAGGGAFFYNYGLWNAQVDQSVADSGGAPGTVFNNFGTFRKSAGTGNTTFQVGVLFNQPSGVLDVQQGELALQGGGSFTGGYITTNVNGLTVLSGGSFNLNGTVTGTNVIEDGGDLIGTNVINSALTWQDGSWNNTVVTVSSNSVLNISTASHNHAMSGCILTNFGTVNWSAGALLAGGGAFFYNYALWNAQADLALLNYNGAPGTVFNNFGTFRKSAGSNAGQTQLGNPVTFNNTGIVDVQTGNLVLQGIGNFTAGYITTNSTGTTYFSSGSFNLNGTATGTNVIENAGNLVGTNVINGALNWQDGSWANTVVTVSSNSLLNINGTVNYAIGGCILTNFGTLSWRGGALLAGGGSDRK